MQAGLCNALRLKLRVEMSTIESDSDSERISLSRAGLDRFTHRQLLILIYYIDYTSPAMEGLMFNVNGG